MALKTLIPNVNAPRLGYPPSRVRKLIQRMRAGFAAIVPNGTTVSLIGGQKHSKAAILAELDALLAAFQAIDTALIQVAEQRAALAKQLPAALELVALLNANFVNLPGYTPAAGRQYNVGPPKPRRPLTAAQKVIAQAKMNETRRKRKTMGKKQKKKIKYDPATDGPIDVTVKPK